MNTKLKEWENETPAVNEMARFKKFSQQTEEHSISANQGYRLASNKKTDSENKLMDRDASIFGQSKTPIFKSRYIDDVGKWTHNAVNEGYVDFRDYINDIKNDEQGISFNGTPMKINNIDQERPKELSDYEIDSEQKVVDYSKSENKITDIANVIAKPVTEFLKKHTGSIYTVSKDTVRLFWKTGADLYLRRKGYESSAWLLEHSLQDNPTDIYRGNDSNLTYMINNSKEYKTQLKSAISKSKNGVLDTKLELVFNTNPDLMYSIHRATIYVKGKKNNGHWFIEATSNDQYDYTEIMTLLYNDTDGFSTSINLGSVANDVALFSQIYGAIKPYNIKLKFYTVI